MRQDLELNKTQIKSSHSCGIQHLPSFIFEKNCNNFLRSHGNQRNCTNVNSDIQYNHCTVQKQMKVCFVLICLISIFSWQGSGSTNYSHEFYDLTLKLKASSGISSYFSLPVVHLIRVPKASSTSLSAIARRIVGCEPRGPCW